MPTRRPLAARHQRRERADRERLTLGLIFGLLSLTAVGALTTLDRGPPRSQRRPRTKRTKRTRRTRRTTKRGRRRQIDRPPFEETVRSQEALVARFKRMRREVEHEMRVALGFEVRVLLRPDGGEFGLNSGVLGWVDDEEVSISPRELNRMRAKGFDVAKLLDLVLIHEAAHVWIRRCHRKYRDGFAFGPMSMASEGHAQYVTRRVCARLDLSETFERFQALDAGESWSDHYVRGERFFRRVVEEVGYYKAVYAVFEETSPQLPNEIRNPPRYLRRLAARARAAQTAKR